MGFAYAALKADDVPDPFDPGTSSGMTLTAHPPSGTVQRGETLPVVLDAEPDLGNALSATGYTFDFGDGTAAGPGESVVTHNYAPGTYTATVTNGASLATCNIQVLEGIIDDTEDDPPREDEDKTKQKYTLSAPSDVWAGCNFNIRAAVSIADATHIAGTGCVLKSRLDAVDIAHNCSPAITAGWSEPTVTGGATWASVGRFASGARTGQQIEWELRGPFNTVYGFSKYQVAHMSPYLADNFPMGSAHEFRITARRQSYTGSTLTGFVGSDSGIVKVWSMLVDGVWTTVTPTETAGTWSNGVRTANVTLPKNALATKVRLAVTYAEETLFWDADLEDLSAVSVELPATINEGDAFTITLGLTDRVGDPVDPIDLDLLTVTVEAYTGGVWSAFAGLADTGAVSDWPPTLWAFGYWSSSTMKVADAAGNTQLRVTVAYNGKTGSDTAAIEIVPTELLLDISERQIAAGITADWDAEDPANVQRMIDTTGDTPYTLAQLIAYVNYIAPSYLVDSLYSGGVDAPELLASDYASGVLDLDSLSVVVLAMQVTKEATTISDNADVRFGDSDYQSNAAWPTAKSMAISAYQVRSPGAYAWDWANVYTEIDVGYSARVYSLLPSPKVIDLPALASSLDLYVYALADDGPGTFDKQGLTIPDENTYGVVASAASAVRSSYTFTDLLNSGNPPPIPPNWPAGAGDLGFYFELGEGSPGYPGAFVLATWAFTHT